MPGIKLMESLPSINILYPVLYGRAVCGEQVLKTSCAMFHLEKRSICSCCVQPCSQYCRSHIQLAVRAEYRIQNTEYSCCDPGGFSYTKDGVGHRWVKHLTNYSNLAWQPQYCWKRLEVRYVHDPSVISLLCWDRDLVKPIRGGGKSRI